MKNEILLQKIIITALSTALCIVLPICLHAIPNAGILFSPMHIPVLLCGIICGWQYGLFCGAAGPLLSCILTSMPVMANLPFMMLELAIYGLVSGLSMQYFPIKKPLRHIYCSLILSMLLGRIIAGLMKALVFTSGSYSLSVWVTGYFVTCLPGIILQLTLIPILYFSLKKAGLIPPKNTSPSTVPW